ncbi:MAG: hypothetical protein QOI25_8, partial [Mycobacterium sp.]|nr:hypothetical protein [Mycobacterium sp.]
RLTAETTPNELGAKSWRDVLTTRLRISRSDARRRLGDTEHLGPRTSMTGEPLEPLLAATAAAQAEGAIGAEHVRIVCATMDALPSWVDATTREQAERDLVGAARGLDPDTLRKVADRLLALIDQDGPMPDDAERARRRGVWFGKQGRDGMTPIKGWLDPQAMATWEPILAKLAAPGMCNADDEHPRASGTPSAEQIEADTRSIGQRNHDALIAIGRSTLASGELGRHNGLQSTIIATVSLQDLQRAAGVAVTGGGSLLPMSYLIRMASHAYHYLAIFDECTWEPLHLGRAKRIASPAQRIMLHSRDVGCTFPGCTVPGYGTQVHHINGWAKHHGLTNIDVEVLACKGHNLMAEQGWTVEIRNGVVVWIPPPGLDTGQARTNDYHHPDRVLKPPDEHDPPNEGGDT